MIINKCPICNEEEAYKKWEYKAAPAANGRIYRLRCLCGELPDGEYYRAEVGENTYHRCERCVGK